MEEYKSNSHKARAEAAKQERKFEKIVTGTVKAKKKGGLHKITDVIISEDASNVKSYILMDVLVPAIKKAISDIVTNGIEMMLYGEAGKRKGSSASRISYSSYYKDDRRARERVPVNNTYDYDDIIISSRGEAEDVLSMMDEIIDTYGVVTIADFYDLVGVTGKFTDNKYGWDDLKSANIVRVRDGFLIRLPRAKVI